MAINRLATIPWQKSMVHSSAGFRQLFGSFHKKTTPRQGMQYIPVIVDTAVVLYQMQVY
jgi:hypothetical protein